MISHPKVWNVSIADSPKIPVNYLQLRARRSHDITQLSSELKKLNLRANFSMPWLSLQDRKIHDQKEFLTASKSLALFPVAMSLLASFQSSVTILGYPAEMFLRGTQFWMVIFAGILAAVVAAEVFLPVYYHLSFTSINEVSCWSL